MAEKEKFHLSMRKSFWNRENNGIWEKYGIWENYGTLRWGSSIRIPKAELRRPQGRALSLEKPRIHQSKPIPNPPGGSPAPGEAPWRVWSGSSPSQTPPFWDSPCEAAPSPQPGPLSPSPAPRYLRWAPGGSCGVYGEPARWIVAP